MTLATGTRLGPYEVIAPLGAGGMGEVLRARDTRLGRDVALKILPATFNADQDRLRRFEQEARAAAALNHPNILAVHDVGTTDRVPYVVSELLEGKTLRQFLEAGPLTTRKAIDYGTQIASGLAAAHEKGIIHRDIKPENIFVTKDGRIKILDFGLAKLAEAAAPDGSGATMAHTDPGTVVGTVGYMSPEQLRGEAVDARSDVFSLGAVLYEMFSGERAFKGKTAVDTMSAILNQDPADFPAAVHASVPAIEQVVRRCLDKNVDERFQSVRDVRFALEAVSNASGITPAGAIDAPRSSRATAARAIAIGVPVLLAATAAAWMAGHSSATTVGPPEITHLTFRSGTVRGARFAPDGQNVIYGAAWEGQPIRLFSTRPGSSDSTALNVPNADLMAVSPSTGEMLATLAAVPSATFYTRGMLARASVAGGAPRAILDNVTAADFSPNGQVIAAIVLSPTGFSLQFPLGTERLKTPYPISHVRVAPDGEQLAFLSHPAGGDEGDVKVLDKTGEPRTISSGWLTLGGLVWADGGKALWFTGARRGGVRALWATTLDGHERLLYRSTESLTLEDATPDGRALLSAGNMRSRIVFGSIHDTSDRELPWFDFAVRPSVSGDGKLVAFTEAGEGAGSSYGVFVRPVNGDAAVRVLDGAGGVISPDGTQVLAGNIDDLHSLILAPTGAGTPKRIPLNSLERIDSTWFWFPDGRHVLINGNEAGHATRGWRLDTASGKFEAITPEGVRARVVSPNGRLVAAGTDKDRYLLDLQTGAKIVPPKGVDQRDTPIGFTADSSAVYAFQPDPQGGQIFRIDISSGTRTLARTLHPSDSAGLELVSAPSMSADGEHIAYNVTYLKSELFLLKLQ